MGKNINVLVGQSGGPTPVINNSLLGVIETCRSYPAEFGKIYAGWHADQAPSLLEILRAAHPLFVNIHVTHPRELTPEATAACEKLADAGIPLGSQTVLLQGINDRVETMKALFRSLLRLRVKPYYLYQCDRIPGSSHFVTPLDKGLEIIDGIRGHTSGLAVPHYVLDAPGGGGKIPLLPEYCISRSDHELVLRNYQHRRFVYPLSAGTSEELPGAGASRKGLS